jgi:large conductance mechanosensitive channel
MTRGGAERAGPMLPRSAQAPSHPSEESTMPEEKKSVVVEFKDFLMRGNVVDMAVGIVIGAAFGALVTAAVRDLLTPIVAALIGKPDFGGLTFTIHHSTFAYGDFINVLISFVSIAAAVFFFVVKPVNYLTERRRRSGTVDEASLSDEAQLLTEIRDVLVAQQSN